jgi:diaminopimelate epimerase
MQLDYIIYDPTHNITALVTSPVPRPLQAPAAADLMRQNPSVEQVGFLEPSQDHDAARLHLQMMGGEFCGNAAMSAVSYLAEQDNLPTGMRAEYLLEVSGVCHTVACEVKNTGDGFLGTVSMPLPQVFGTATLPCQKNGSALKVPAVWFPGIAHCIVPAANLTREQAEREIYPKFEELCASMHVDACGILLFDRQQAFFEPYVYVSATHSAVWESGCGSGSAAIGALLAHRRGSSVSIALRQPGGVIHVRATIENHRMQSLTITGMVRRTCQNSAELSE